MIDSDDKTANYRKKNAMCQAFYEIIIFLQLSLFLDFRVYSQL